MFPKEILKELFREKYLACLRDAGIHYPHSLHKITWVARIQAAGRGEPALKYLSKYLYRGVIQERNILSDENGKITFEYEESETKLRKTRTLPAADFLFLVLKHVLPKRFRRSRDYGFHHGNARKTLNLIQLLLHHAPPILQVSAPWKYLCPSCGTPMVATDFQRPNGHVFIHDIRNRGSPAPGSQTS